MRRAIGAVLWAIGWLGLAGCSATIPDGIYACERDSDCPSGFECRREEGYCFRPGSSSAGSDGGAGSGSPPAGASGAGRAGSAPAGRGAAGADGGVAGSDGGEPPAKVAPSATGFSSLGEPRKGPGLVLYGERFESDERRCSADGRLCVTGGFEP